MKREKKKLIAVIINDGDGLVVTTTIPSLTENRYECCILTPSGIKAVSGSLRYWADRLNTIPVYEGDEIKVKF